LGNRFKNYFSNFANQIPSLCYFDSPSLTKPLQSNHMFLCLYLRPLLTAKIPRKFEFKWNLNSFENQFRNLKQKKKKEKELEKGRRQDSSPATELAQLAHPGHSSPSRTRQRTQTAADDQTPPPLRAFR
jgi:hypothetical protein